MRGKGSISGKCSLAQKKQQKKEGGGEKKENALYLENRTIAEDALFSPKAKGLF